MAINKVISIEVENKNSKNILVTCCYRPPSGDVKKFNIHLESVFKKANKDNRIYFILGDFNLNCLEYQTKRQINIFYNRIFEHGCIPLITKPTRITSKTATLIDNILTNTVFDTSMKTGIIKNNLSDHFPIFVSLKMSSEIRKEKQNISIQKREINEANTRAFKFALANVKWDFLNLEKDTNSKYSSFLTKFSEIYENHFPLKNYKIKQKDIQSPWISKGLKKSSKQKQKLYVKFLKTKSPESEIIYKDYKNLFEKLRKKSKQTYYQSLLKNYQNDMKRTWQIMKEITGKIKSISDTFPKSIKVKEKSITQKN